jgi:DNA-binding transcriptional LysR family regulator
MDMKTLEAFLVLSEQLNFTKSAEQLYITQPAFSRQITKLEEELGCQLFERNKRKVELTSHGQEFQKHAQLIYAEYSRWNMKAKLLQKEKTGVLRLGFLKYAPHRIIPAAVRRFREIHSGIEIVYKECDMPEVQERILNDKIDIGITFAPRAYTHNNSGAVDMLELDDIPLCVAVASDHALADRPSILLSDLAQENFILDMPKGIGSGLQHTIYLCTCSGFNPNITTYADGVPAMLVMVACGAGISIVADTAKTLAPEGVCIIPLENTQPDKLALLWRKDTQNPAVPDFVETCKTLLL